MGAIGIDIAVNCPAKRITVTWKVVVWSAHGQGKAAHVRMTREIKSRFERAFNNNGQFFKVGDCTVRFVFDVDETAEVKIVTITDLPDIESGAIPTDGRDAVVIGPPTGNGEGLNVGVGGDGPSVVWVSPNDQSELGDSIVINETGEAMGIAERGPIGEWNDDGVKAEHIRELLQNLPSRLRDKQIEINDCCGGLRIPARWFAKTDRDEDPEGDAAEAEKAKADSSGQ